VSGAAHCNVLHIGDHLLLLSISDITCPLASGLFVPELHRIGRGLL